ncbi:MAG: DUF2637 domain-containing protein [Trebonia sp.]
MTNWIKSSWSRLTAGLAHGVVAAVTGVISYTHVYDLTVSLHQSMMVARLMPFGVDGLIVVGSVVLLQSAPGQAWLGWLGVVPGVAASLFANVESGLRWGPLAAGWAGVPAASFALATFLLERWLKAQASRGGQSGTETSCAHSGGFVESRSASQCPHGVAATAEDGGSIVTAQVGGAGTAHAGAPGWQVLDGEPLLRTVATAIVLLSRRQAPGDPVYEAGVQRAYNQLVLHCLRVGVDPPASVPDMARWAALTPLAGWPVDITPAELDGAEFLVDDATRTPTQGCLELALSVRDAPAELFENMIIDEAITACRAAQSPGSYNVKSGRLVTNAARNASNPTLL